MIELFPKSKYGLIVLVRMFVDYIFMDNLSISIFLL